MNRKQAREMAFQALFQMALSDTDRATALEALNGDGRPVDPYVTRLIEGVSDHIEDIDRLIEAHLDHWSFSRIGNVDRTLLRLSVCELLYFEDIPEAVSINEAVVLAKKYGDEEVGKFVNGVLSGVARRLHDNSER